jgi:serine protease inhibitor
LPKDRDTSPLEKSLSLEWLVEWKKALRDGQVDVYLPKFTFATKCLMAKNLEDMSMAAAFTLEQTSRGSMAERTFSQTR